MPVHAPGPRLLTTKACKHRRRWVGRPSIVILPLIDLMLVLTLFLLPQFGGSGELCCVHTFELPEATNTAELERAPIVTIAASTGETLWKENSLGWPVWYNRVRLVRPGGADATVDEIGEIWVKGPNVFLGYHKAPAATTAALTSDGWLRTGDLARADAEGCLYFEGRLGATIKSGGENVDALEVEEAILAAATEVRMVAVVGRIDAKWGEMVVACCVLHPDERLDAATLQERLRPHLAGFKLPREVHFLEALPVTESGAVDRAQLSEFLQATDTARG